MQLSVDKRFAFKAQAIGSEMINEETLKWIRSSGDKHELNRSIYLRKNRSAGYLKWVTLKAHGPAPNFGKISDIPTDCKSHIVGGCASLTSLLEEFRNKLRERKTISLLNKYDDLQL